MNIKVAALTLALLTAAQTAWATPDTSIWVNAQTHVQRFPDWINRQASSLKQELGKDAHDGGTALENSRDWLKEKSKGLQDIGPKSQQGVATIEKEAGSLKDETLKGADKARSEWDSLMSYGKNLLDQTSADIGRLGNALQGFGNSVLDNLDSLSRWVRGFINPQSTSKQSL